MHRGATLTLAFGGMLALAAAAGPPARADATAPAPGDAAKGTQLFQSAGCGWCHENGGRTAGKGPQLAGTARSDSFIRFRVTHGQEGAMPAFGGTFSPAQIGDIIAYIRSLKE